MQIDRDDSLSLSDLERIYSRNRNFSNPDTNFSTLQISPDELRSDIDVVPNSIQNDSLPILDPFEQNSEAREACLETRTLVPKSNQNFNFNYDSPLKKLRW